MYRSKNQLGSRAHTFGVLVDWLGDAYQAPVLQGIAESAAHCGANILYFIGGLLPADPTAEGSSRHRVYELAGAHNVDGVLLLSSTLIHNVGGEGLRKFASGFAGVPLCSVGVDLPEATSVTVDNGEGMRAIVRHLIDKHGARRIAFIAGPPDHAEARVRREAYVSALAERGIVPDDALIAGGDFTGKAGVAAVQALVKRRVLEGLDAIVAANDGMAMGAMEELERMNVSIPGKIAVTGFDDIDDARLAQPPLTTVRQPLTRQGQEGVRLLAQSILSRSQAADMQTETELILRASCGCGTGEAAPSMAPPAANRRFLVSIMGRRSHIAAKLGRVARGALSGASSGWEEKLIGAIIEDIESAKSSEFLQVFRKISDRWLAHGADLAVIDGVITVLRRELIPLLNAEPDKKDLAEELFQLARLTISEHVRRHLGRAQRDLTRETRRIALVCNSLATCFSFARLRRRIKEEVPGLGVRSCFVALYDEVNQPAKARLFAGFDLGGTDPGGEGASFSGPRLLPQELIETKGPGRSYAVLPLTCDSGMLGHVLFEYQAKNAFACGVLAEAISIAVRGARASGERW